MESPSENRSLTIHDTHGDAVGTQRVRVLVCDSHELYRLGLRLVIDTAVDLTLAGETTDPRQALMLHFNARPHVVVVGQDLAGGASLELIRRFSAQGIAVLVLAESDARHHVVESLQAGAHGYLHRRVSPRRLLEGIRAVARHETVVDSALAEYLLPYLDPAVTATHLPVDGRLTSPHAPAPVALSPVLPGDPVEGEDRPVAETGAGSDARVPPYPPTRPRTAWLHSREDLGRSGTELSAEPALTRASMPPGSLETLLTRRQMMVASLVADGLSNSEIASRLYLSPATVKSHLTIILRRLELRDRTQLAILVTRQRELDAPIPHRIAQGAGLLE